MVNYKLLTPGPLTTSKSVKTAMLVDHCTWDDDYKSITLDIRKRLLKVAGLDQDQYTVVFMQGSGTYGVESMFTSLVGKDDKVLIITNGKYGERIVQIAEYAGRDHEVYDLAYDEWPEADKVDEILKEDQAISHVVMVHSETTTGILNNIDEIGQVVKDHGKVFMVDAMSSFGGVPIDFKDIDALVSSANKCIQGVPGFSFVIVKKDLLEACEGNATTLSLDLYDQYKDMEDGKWRYTSPTHTVVAFQQALTEFEEEGGTEARHKRYDENQKTLVKGMEELGFESYLDERVQGPIITTFLYPDLPGFDFNDMYDYVKRRGYALYPGKLMDIGSFRVGNIGEIYLADIENVLAIIEDYLETL